MSITRRGFITALSSAALITAALPRRGLAAGTHPALADQLAARLPKIAPHMDDAKAEVLAFNTFPRVSACRSPHTFSEIPHWSLRFWSCSRRFSPRWH